MPVVTTASPAAMADDDVGRDYSDGMMSETFYPMNHVSWVNEATPGTPVSYIDKETQFYRMFEDRSTSVSDLHTTLSANPSADSGYGEHAPLPSTSSCVTEDASQEPSKQASTSDGGGLYSELGSTSTPDRDKYNLEDEIVHLSEEPLTSGEDECGGVITSQDGVPRIDAFDGVATSMSQAPEDSCGVDCLYYTLRCCDCRII